ncbi:MAG TPA: thiamine-phosphate kinase [Dehalococcoidia bacterium]|nr:thiamine-phosphate kinase [Dehalococcoidia bacterium]
MQLMDDVLENSLIGRLACTFPRSPEQRNRLHETDAELIALPGSDTLLALTTDWVVEEIESGLYADPYLIGWMTVIVNASDLAAVGASPLGILINENLPRDAAPERVRALQNGIRDACAAAGLYVLGGDTNISSRLEMGGTAVGLIEGEPPLTRIGCVPGDYVMGSGPFGSGAGLAFVRFVLHRRGAGVAFWFQPEPRMREGRLLRRFASSCMDTSDGFLATLDQLMRLNSVGFDIDCAAKTLVDPATLALSQSACVPAWLALAAHHGEFELVFTVPPDGLDSLRTEAATIGWEPRLLGRVVQQPRISLSLDANPLTVDMGLIRNLFVECGDDIDAYFQGLLQVDAATKDGGQHHGG